MDKFKELDAHEIVNIDEGLIIGIFKIVFKIVKIVSDFAIVVSETYVDSLEKYSNEIKYQL